MSRGVVYIEVGGLHNVWGRSDEWQAAPVRRSGVTLARHILKCADWVSELSFVFGSVDEALLLGTPFLPIFHFVSFLESSKLSVAT